MEKNIRSKHIESIKLRASRKLLLAIFAGFTFFQSMSVAGYRSRQRPATPIIELNVQFHGTFCRVRFLFLILKMHPETDMRKTMNAADQPHNNQLNRALETIRQGAIAGAAGGLAEIASLTHLAAATESRGAGARRNNGCGGKRTVPGRSNRFGRERPYGDRRDARNCARFRLAGRCPYVTCRQSVRFHSRSTAFAAVWAINFFVVLPIIRPGFHSTGAVHERLLILSKLLFGLSTDPGVFRQLAAPALIMERARDCAAL